MRGAHVRRMDRGRNPETSNTPGVTPAQAGPILSCLVATSTLRGRPYFELGPGLRRDDIAHVESLVLLIFDLGRNDAVGPINHTALVGTLLQRVDRFHAGNDLAEDSVLAIEEAGIRIGDEELRVGAIGIRSAGHAE